MPVTAKVIANCWDSPSATGYSKGSVIEGFDPESDAGRRLSSLQTSLGEWIFQYPGHEGRGPLPPKRNQASFVPQKVEQKPESVEAKVIEPPKVDRRYKPMSQEHKAKMMAGRAARKAQRMERLQQASA
jgi:hypothetical protein